MVQSKSRQKWPLLLTSLGNLDTEDIHCQILAAKTPCVVMSIDYPLASPPGNNLIDVIIDSGVQAVNWVNPPLA